MPCAPRRSVRIHRRLERLRALNVVCHRSDIGRVEVVVGVLREPQREPGHLLAELADGLGVHVGLGDELGHFDCHK
jgi:hypothetical protein